MMKATLKEIDNWIDEYCPPCGLKDLCKKCNIVIMLTKHPPFQRKTLQGKFKPDFDKAVKYVKIRVKANMGA